MEPTSEEVRKAEEQIIEVLSAKGGLSPEALLHELVTKQVRDYAGRMAIWFLLDDRRLDLSYSGILSIQGDGRPSSRQVVAAR